MDNIQKTGKIEYKVKEGNSEQRINEMKKWLRAAIEEWEPDFVGIENI